jgi:hypothetical protein
VKSLLASSLTVLLAISGCKGDPSEVPPVQDSALGEPRTTLSLNRQLQGRYRAIAPSCVGQQYQITSGGVQAAGGLAMRPGHTAEFRNYLPDVPTNVTSLGAPATMFSPNLVRPYNLRKEGGEEFSAWRFTFSAPGVYEYADTNMGDPGRKVVDSYYGTVSYVGESTAPRGVVCVDPPGCVAAPECLSGEPPAGAVCCPCIGVCCLTDAHCEASRTCLRSRCVDKVTGE